MQDGGGVGVEGWVRNKAECISPAMEPQQVERTEGGGGGGVKCYKCNAGGEYKCVRIVWLLFRSVRLCEFDGSVVCSEPLLTSAAVARLVQQERHSPSIKGCVQWGGGQGLGSTPPNGIRVRTSIYRGNLKDAQLFHLILCCAAKCVTVSH